MGNPLAFSPLPSGVTYTQYYTRVNALTNAQGRATDVITADEGNVTVSGITNAGPDSASVEEAFLFGYQVGAGLPEESQVYASSDTGTSTDLNETDSNGNELYSWSVTLPTAGLAPGVYALQSFVYTPAIVQTNGIPSSIHVFEPDQGTVTVDEFVPFTYVVKQDTEIVTVGPAQATMAVSLPDANATVQLSSDGRYAVWASGDQYEEDLRTGATVDLTATGAQAPALAVTHATTVTEVGSPSPYGPVNNGGYGDITYPTFTEGGTTFGTIPDFDFNANDGTQNPLPTVTDSSGDTEVLAPFGVSKTMAGYAAAASDNGNAVLTIENSDVHYQGYGSSYGLTASPQYYVVYRSAAPTLTLAPVNGTNQFRPTGPVTLTGTSNAVGQTVEIDFGQAGAEVGTATVQADGTWQFGFDAGSITGSSLFIEASVSSALGTPAETSETAQISNLPLPKVTGITGQDENRAAIFGPGEMLTIKLDTNEPVYVTGAPTLTLSNGEAATYSGGSGTTELDFTYVPGIHDTGSSNLAVTGLNLSAGASIGDADKDRLAGPFTQTLRLILQTTPDITGLSPASNTSNFITRSNSPGISVSAEAGETITVYDNGVAVGTGTTPDDGYPGITFIAIDPTTPLPEGQSTLTAVAVDVSGFSSTVSDPVAISVDTTPPAESILSLAVNGTDDVDLAHQASLSVTITGRLNSPLQPGESVVVVFPGGNSETVTPATGVTGFSVIADASDAAQFGVSGTVTAYVVDTAGNVGTIASQTFTADSLRTIKLVSGDPADPSQSTEAFPAISGDGRIVAFDAAQQNNEPDAVTVSDNADTPGITQGIYLQTVATGAVTLAVAGGEAPSLSSDGTILAYVGDGSYPSQVYVKDLATGMVTQVSANGVTPGDSESYGPSLSGDGAEVAFLSSADNLVAGVGAGQSNLQVYVATLSGDAVASIAAITVAPSDGSQANGTSEAVSLSGDGSEVAFTSDAVNLLAAGDNHTANLGGYNEQVYVHDLTANTASGMQAGQVELVTGTADGTVGDGTSGDVSLSADGRYAVFISAADNLAPGNLEPGATLPLGTNQVYVKDLLTGTLSLVSQTSNGVVGDFGATSASISADGKTVVFSDNSDNLGAGNAGEELYQATLSSGGEVTELTVLSAAGAIPGNGSSDNPSLSADGVTVVFQSTASNLIAGAPEGSNPNHVYTTSLTQKATTASPTTVTVTNTNDTGAGSLRAALAAAQDGDTIVFAPDIAGGTITLDSTLTVAAGVTIDGLGRNITVSGNGAVTVFDVAITSGNEALIEGLTIADGAGTGAAGAVAVDNFNDQTGAPATIISAAGAGAAGAGGVDLSAGVLTLLQDDFTDDVATGGAGGEGTDSSQWNAEDGGAGGGAGGAVAVGTGARLFGSDLTFSHNMATGGIGGHAADKAAGGSGGTAGGAIYVDQAATVSLANITLDDNTAVGGVAGNPGGTGGAGGNAGGGVYVAGDATVSANGLNFTGDAATGGAGGGHGGEKVGIKGAGVGGDAAGAIFVGGGTSFTPFNFTYSGDSASTGIDGNGDPGTSGGVPDSSAPTYAYAYTNTNLTTASVAGPPPGSTGEDGYIVGATVSYENGSGTPATTDAVGGFTLTGGTGPITLTGGTDSATGLPFTTTLFAPAGSMVISPLTTLVQALAEAAGDTSAAGVAQANARVLASLSLPGTVNLTTFDAEDALLGTGLSAAALETASQVFEADNYLESAGRLIAGAGGSATGTIAAIAQKLAAGQALDLTAPATLFANAGLSAAATSALVDIATATISAVQAQIGGGITPGAVLVDISGASIADQRDAVALLSTAVQSGTDAAFQQADSSFVGAVPQTLAADDDQVPCFTTGTRIATPGGEVDVQQLVIGDRVTLAGGGDAPIVWIGRRSYDGRFIRGRRDILPVCIHAGALGNGLPKRDLTVSPLHAMLLDGVLVPAGVLVNGTTVTQADSIDMVHYVHIELDHHDVLLAEGAPAESFVDDDSRAIFHNAHEWARLYPGRPRVPAMYYAPRVVDGEALEQIKCAIDLLAGLAIPGRHQQLRGQIDGWRGDAVWGWAQNPAKPEVPVCLEAWVGGVPVSRTLANLFRTDLREAGIGSGCHGFHMTLPESALGREVEVRRVIDGKTLGVLRRASVVKARRRRKAA